jgi:hypothetical protein
MPLDLEKGVIHTRVLNIAKKDDIGRLRQSIIREMYETPDQVKSVYLVPDNSGASIEVRVVFDNGRGSYSIGNIKADYHKIVSSNPIRVKSWKITGGYPIESTSHDKKLRAYFGMNLTIELLNHVARTNSEPRPEVHSDQRGVFD